MRSKPLVIVVISLLVIALIYSSFSRSDVFAKGVTRGSLDCTSGINGREVCCQDETGSQGIVIRWCTVCDATSPPSNCSPRFNSGTVPITPPKSNDGGSPKDDGVLPQPPLTPPKSNDAQVSNGSGPIQQTPPPPSTALQQTTCPDGSARDASGNCPLVTQTPPSPALNNNNNNNNNNPTPDHQKGSNLGQIGGGQSVTKKGNSDNSPTPPACPDKGPIPPDCTLKPKF
jgi:hypothetical protein